MNNFFKDFTPKEIFLIFCWALYDLANQFFALNIISVYFPRWLTIEKGSPEIFYSLAFGSSMLLVGVTAPILGTISDKQGRKKSYMAVCTLISVVFTLALGLTDMVLPAIVFFALANFGCQQAEVFYNSLLVHVAKRKYVGFVSGLGGVFSYGGALLIMQLTKPVLAQKGYQAVFLMSGVAFLVFSLPALIWVKEPPPIDQRSFWEFLKSKKNHDVWGQMKALLSRGSKVTSLRRFLRGYFLALCAVQTIILFLGVYTAKVFELTDDDVVDLVGFSTVFAVLGSIISSVVTDRLGNKKSMIGVLFLWILGLLGAVFLHPPFQWAIGAIIGFALASTWVVARAWGVKASPKEDIGKIFGLFKLVGYAAGLTGPLIWSAINKLLTPMGEWGYRLSFLSLIFFFLWAMIEVFRIPEEKES